MGQVMTEKERQRVEIEKAVADFHAGGGQVETVTAQDNAEYRLTWTRMDKNGRPQYIKARPRGKVTRNHRK